MLNELVSVIVPVYNASPFLSRCIDSILGSTYSNLEVICVNDGSKDNSLEILRAYQELDDRIVVLDQPNGGVSAARNKGMDNASGSMIAFIDSDDFIHPQYFELLLIAINDADISCCGMIETNCYVAGGGQTLSEIRAVGLTEADKSRITDHVWGKLFRKDLIERLRFEESIRFGEDKLFTSLAVQIAHKIVVIDNKLYYYFMNMNSAVHIMEHNMYSVACKFLEDAEANGHGLSLKYAYTGFLSYRYSKMFDENRRRIARDCNQRLRECIKTSSRILTRKERILLYFMYKIPFLYRIYRITGDRTMLDWEKVQRKNKTNSRVAK